MEKLLLLRGKRENQLSADRYAGLPTETDFEGVGVVVDDVHVFDGIIDISADGRLPKEATEYGSGEGFALVVDDARRGVVSHGGSRKGLRSR